MSSLLNDIFTTPELRANPPVLVDIGASGRLPRKWEPFARYSLCIAFDPDERELDYIKEEGGRYRQLNVFRKIVTDSVSRTLPFHLTRSPYCSSVLTPRVNELRRWAFSDLFTVEKTVEMPCARLPDVLAQVDVSRVDWFKTDSQGTDLRLFRSLGESIQKTTLVAEFEPGIMDAYEGEDKLWELMRHMDALPFWMAEMDVNKAHRVDATLWAGRPSAQRAHPNVFLKGAPAWAEVCYMNSFANDFGKREHMLGWVFAMANAQYGFALHLCDRAETLFPDPLLKRMRGATERRIRRGYLRILGLAIRKIVGR